MSPEQTRAHLDVYSSHPGWLTFLHGHAPPWTASSSKAISLRKSVVQVKILPKLILHFSRLWNGHIWWTTIVTGSLDYCDSSKGCSYNSYSFIPLPSFPPSLRSSHIDFLELLEPARQDPPSVPCLSCSHNWITFACMSTWFTFISPNFCSYGTFSVKHSQTTQFKIAIWALFALSPPSIEFSP